MAQPSRFTPQVCSTVFGALDEGQTVAAACKAAGISTVLYYRWLGRGAAGESPYAEFRARAADAIARGERARIERNIAACRIDSSQEQIAC